MSKQFSSSTERNKHPIFEQLSVYFKDRQSILEIGSGTGQHAIFFAPKMPHLTWHTSDMPESHASIQAWISESGSGNISNPTEFTVGQDAWPNVTIDAVFTANTTHIMQPQEAQIMMEMVAKNLPEGGVFCQYGPMMVNGEHTSDSNQAFNQSLRQGGFGGIPDINQLASWAEGMNLAAKIPMPSNNFLLVWKK
jgi:cyclopropane fatty-acyl-phospholipid synthase-like methyltransferase